MLPRFPTTDVARRSGGGFDADVLSERSCFPDAPPARGAPVRDEAPRRVNRFSNEKRDWIDGSIHWSRLQALSPRGHEALPQGRALLHREVLVHAPAVPPRAARASANQAQ